MICSPSGFCASLSWSMVSCGKRGSLPVAGAANIVAASQPLAAASTSDDIKMADFMNSSGRFLGLPGDANSAASAAPAGRPEYLPIRLRRYRRGRFATDSRRLVRSANSFVMAGLVPAIHVLFGLTED